ncbi:hypothetical protein JQ633_33190 [Bradyrhizobium tropiciagri]|uniref:hypothetical protein n=1 Tax=Bradyrhizobium tropiciagri TaxID=312253 RepID=UPI001BA494D9|nr:hypothetical protein [Bradyrhizobium tropiciagri]MBR0875256.1 hypothetical protein [Bradyrhizobium tropiciagri]
MTSQSAPEQQPNQPPILRTNGRPGTLSKVAGAGVGSGWIVIAQKLGLGEPWTLVVESAAPWVAVGIGVVGPLITGYIMNKVRLRGLKSIIADAEAQVASAPVGSQSRATAEANLEQLRQMINENLIDTASIFHTRGHAR